MHRGEASWLGLLEHARTLDPDPALQHLTDDDLEREVRDGASRIAALECQWLLHVGELIVRGVWADQGARTPGQWLSWACGMDGSTGREKSRVALALRELPQIRARFAEGTLSYSKVRAITRVASPEIEDQLLQLADAAPASLLVRLLQAGRRSADEELRWEDGPPDPPSPADVRSIRRVVVDQETMELRIRLPVDECLAAEERLDRLVDLADRTDREARCEEEAAADGAGEQTPRPPRGARRASALVDALAVAVAAGAPDRSGIDDHLVVVHVTAEELAAAVAEPEEPAVDPAQDPAAGQVDDPADDVAAGASADAAGAPGRTSRQHGPRAPRVHVTTGRGRGMMLPRGVVARLACDGDVRLAGTRGGRGHPADIGRRSRQVPAELRRALHLRDRHCRFPGCHQSRHLHAHHVVHWARGGATDLANLVLLCTHHHQFVHDRGWSLRPVRRQPGRWTFHAPGSDMPLQAQRPMPGASADAAAASSTDDAVEVPPPRALQPPWWDGEPYDPDETVRIISEALADVAA